MDPATDTVVSEDDTVKIIQRAGLDMADTIIVVDKATLAETPYPEWVARKSRARSVPAARVDLVAEASTTARRAAGIVAQQESAKVRDAGDEADRLLGEAIIESHAALRRFTVVACTCTFAAGLIVERAIALIW